MDWYIKALKNWKDFAGRSRRKEYWFFILINAIISIGLSIVDQIIGTANAESGFGVLGTVYALVILVPAIAVTIRRLHDTNKSGWWILIIFIPIIGPLVLLYFMIIDSDEGDNQYGPNPKAGETASAGA